MHGVVPRQLEGLYAKFTIARHERERAWVFVCRECGNEYTCSCFSTGTLTDLQIKHLKDHHHKRSEDRR